MEQSEKSLEIMKKRNITEQDIFYLKQALERTLNELNEYGASILPHLSDTDMNSGEQLRYFMWKCGLGDIKKMRSSMYHNLF